MLTLKGTLTGAGLPAIVQLIGQLHYSGSVWLVRSGRSGVLGFDNGRLVSAGFGGLRGTAAIAACADELADAEFTFFDYVPNGERTLDLGAAELTAVLRAPVQIEPPARESGEPLEEPARAAAVRAGPRLAELSVVVGMGTGLVALAAAVVIAVNSVSAPALQQAPALTPVPRQTPVATLAPRPTLPALPAVAPSAMDVDFAAGPVDGWINHPPFAAWRNGAYQLQAAQAGRFVGVGAPSNPAVFGDVYVAARFRKAGGPPGGSYGLIVRDQGPGPRDGVNQRANAYVLAVGDRGEYGIWRRADDRWLDIVAWTPSSDLHTGAAANDLAVRAVGDRLSFTVNGVELVSVQDTTLTSGAVGVFTGGDYNVVDLDKFALQVPR